MPAPFLTVLARRTVHGANGLLLTQGCPGCGLTSVVLLRRMMRVEQQYQAMRRIKPEIDKRLGNADFQGIKELLLWLAQSEDYLRLKGGDNQLRMLDIFCSIWVEEKKQLSEMGIEDDIFGGVNSLRDIEKKYLMIEYAVMRLERAMPEELYEQAAENLMENKISGIAISKIIYLETLEKEKNALKMARLLKKRSQFYTAMVLLQRMEEDYFPANRDLLAELAECWVTGRQWEQALGCLRKIENPDEAVQEKMRELEKNISHDNL